MVGEVNILHNRPRIRPIRYNVTIMLQIFDNISRNMLHFRCCLVVSGNRRAEIRTQTKQETKEKRKCHDQDLPLVGQEERKRKCPPTNCRGGELRRTSEPEH